jgi:hypothetical protein
MAYLSRALSVFDLLTLEVVLTQKSVWKNLTRTGFDHNVDLASQEKLKVANCLTVITTCLFLRFKGSWGAEYVLREVWSNQNEWADKTNAQLPDPEANNDANDGEDSRANPRNSDDEEDRGRPDQQNEDEDEDDEGEDENPRSVVFQSWILS